MGEEFSSLEGEQQLIRSAHSRGTAATLGVYFKLSGPGWLQSALTLGAGSLGSSLYLGILAGFSLLWLQPLAMIFGIIMLSAISYVTLSISDRPFRAVNRFNPVLGWSWLAATLTANMVWALPQYSLCYGVVEQNLFPQVFQQGGWLSPERAGVQAGPWIVSIAILIITTAITWSYGSGSWGVRLYEKLLKAVVAIIVLCFIAVVLRIALVGDGIVWGELFRGFIPSLRQTFEPAATFRPLLDAIADPTARRYWNDLIVSEQRDVMLAAAATAVGINMTFLLPYSLLSRGWNRDFRGMTIFDLVTGTFIPFVIAISCVIIAGAQQFHTKLPEGFVVAAQELKVPERFAEPFDKLLAARKAVRNQYGFEKDPSHAEQHLAAVLVRRDTYDLSRSLQQLFGGNGHLWANIFFGTGAVAMTLSSISLLMLISGFVVCEIANVPPRGWIFRIGCLFAATGVFWPLIWQGEARAWLTVTASVFGGMLLPIAYITFFLMMNDRHLLGSEMPQGRTRIIWNILMALAVLAATTACLSAIVKKIGIYGLVIAGAYGALVLVVQLTRRSQKCE